MNQFKRISIESFLVVILIISLAISMSMMILQGSRNFDSMLESKNQSENFRIALSYINMMVKQNDVAGSITITKNFADGNSALTIKHQGDESGLATYIYSYKDKLYEEYGEVKENFNLDLATEITDCEAQFSKENETINISYKNKAGNSYKQIIAVRTKAGKDENKK